MLGYAWNELLGVTHFFGAETLDKTLLPPQQTIGQLVTVTMDNGRTATMLEAPFDYGRWLLLRAFAQTPISPETAEARSEYKLYNDWLWQFAPPVVDEWLHTLWRVATPGETIDSATLIHATAALFQHPVMASWQLRNWALFPVAYQNQLPTQEVVAALLTQINQSADSGPLTAALTAGLRVQAGWLYIAKQTELANQAHQIAQQLPNLSITENPVLAHLLTSALAQARRG